MSTSGGTSGGEGGANADGGTNAAGTDAGGMSGSGGTGFGGASGVAGSSTGGSGGSSGTGGSGGGGTGGVADPESPCNTPGALACAGNHQRVSLVCSGGVWQVNEVCDASEACDTTPGINQGSCREIVPECVEREPGDAFCDGPTTLQVCGPDNVTLDTEECTGSCHVDACDNRPNHCLSSFYINCGTECRERDADCMDSACASFTGVFLQPEVSVAVRTADYAGTCASECDSQIHGLRLLLRPLVDRKVTVAAPWRIAATSAAAGGATCPETSVDGCLVLNPEDGDDVYVFTDDPTADEQHIVLQTGAEDEQLECP